MGDAAMRARASGKEPKLSREWIREIERRVRDSDNPVRYMLVSEYNRSFILYYNVSDDMFAMNAPERLSPFKGPAWANKKLSSRSRRRRRGPTALP